MDGANRHDMKLVRATVDSLPVPRPAPSPDQPQGMAHDQGTTLDEFGFTAHIRSRGEEAKAIKREAVQSQALGGGTLASWLNRFRASWSAGISLPTNIAFLHFACALTALRAAVIRMS